REYAAWIERQMTSERRVIVNAPVRFYEKTSGSTGPQKFVPFTDALQASFTRMFMHWARDVVAYGPSLETARVFFLVSPSFDVEEHTGAGVPVGLEDDSQYLTGWVGALLRRFLVNTSGLGSMRDVEQYKLALATRLLAAE